MPIVILEGVDCAGKSTLAEELALQAEKNGYAVRKWHKGPPPPGTSIRDEYERPFFNPPIGPNEFIICDRWHVGETIYGPMLRGESRLDHVQRFHLELVLAGLGALLVYVQVPDATLVNRLRKRGDDLVDLNQALRINERYRVDAINAQMPHQHVNGVVTATSSAPRLFRTVVSRGYDSFGHRGSYLGGVHPELLLVGDRRSDHDEQRQQRAPFPPYSKAGCSHWFMELLLSNFRHTKLGVINAFETVITQPAAVQDLLEHVRTKPRVVALGREASAALSEARVPHGIVPHPQWWKRFRHHERTEYAQLIRRAAADRKDYI